MSSLLKNFHALCYVLKVRQVQQSNCKRKRLVDEQPRIIEDKVPRANNGTARKVPQLPPDGPSGFLGHALGLPLLPLLLVVDARH
eukprot:CAMPEP_0179471436 /NCGR_PEP_ID=MMETSP0799-20121207/51673_1 /TAXON_ID=46947 /ORGANISM="Geminigera cryophila, Strain CCMP2564" /LENGTH=84 /DNA_ID=CAMNT_0021279059 /DNA_START=588 /DNA_END=842 /DNA_ORIENTATION=-